jgi:hypothetical protein
VANEQGGGQPSREMRNLRPQSALGYRATFPGAMAWSPLALPPRLALKLV